MEYVEMHRSRRVLTWFTLALLAALGITALSMYAGHAQVHNGSGIISFTDVLIACSMGAFIIATCVAPGLIAEDATLAIAWTRPTPRWSIAVRYVAVDVATIVIGYFILCAIVVAFIALFGALKNLELGSGTLPAFALGLGAAVMWYGLVTLVTSRFPGRGGLIAGMSWVAFILVGTLWAAPFPAPLHGLLTVLNYLDPIAYINGVTTSDAHAHAHPVALSEGARIAVAWLIGAAAIAGTVRLWSTREV
jgi:hypothetical protein